MNSSCSVLVVDGNRTRRLQLAAVFRSAGCEVAEAASANQVARALTTPTPWVVAVVGSILTTAFCDANPSVPIVRLGDGNDKSIAGRMSIDAHPGLSGRAHSLVPAAGSR